MIASNNNSSLTQRFRSAIPWALRHLILSLVIVSTLATLVLFLWFPWPLMEISGGWSLILLIFAVDVVCGPSLTLLLLHPGKSRKALWVDIGLIFTIQISAFMYGVYSFTQARPIALVFEVDRFRVVSYADVDLSRPDELPRWLSVWNFSPPRLLGVRSAKNSQEKMESVETSLQGVEPGQRPDWWQDYALSLPQIKERAKPLENLLALNPLAGQNILNQAARAIEHARENETSRTSELLWLPVVSAKTMDWVAFVDPHSGRIRGYVRADGFGI